MMFAKCFDRLAAGVIAPPGLGLAVTGVAREGMGIKKGIVGGINKIVDACKGRGCVSMSMRTDFHLPPGIS
jgi:hypothetical protein